MEVGIGAVFEQTLKDLDVAHCAGRIDVIRAIRKLTNVRSMLYQQTGDLFGFVIVADGSQHDDGR